MLVSTLLALAPALALAAPATVIDKRAPIIEPRGATIIPGKYIVKFKESASAASIDAAIAKLSHKADHVFKAGQFKGFAGKISEEHLETIQSIPEVEYIELDSVYKINTYVSQTGAPWGLGAISHHSASTTYVYDSSAGAGTCAYIIDTGIYTAHSQFGGRATWLANYAGDGSNTDGNGHGTHVAGTVGGSTYGVAKATKLYAVKVLDASGSGTNSGVIAGINFVATDSKTRSCPNGTVANMSLGGSKSTATNSAAAALVSAGVFLAVAAGNDNANAANYSPASESTACTVAASTSANAKASYSNYGALVDIWAPGTSVLSSWIGSTTATNTISGTSMATPHITGLGAYLLTLFGPKTPAALCAFIASTATSGLLTGVPSGTVNKLAFNSNPSA
ncbi:peptidase S8/S53 domain-containing protein [Cercophora scortea]|uniref:Peptidase S8/S53 domain-containing protein n=1 Tax=Cercophora scortea TaxID=314031 RepID=A0AAE0MCR8_9PEZI|nr:peptidase S8/S53 domain-containing protein [Cercophora scortea]